MSQRLARVAAMLSVATLPTTHALAQRSIIRGLVFDSTGKGPLAGVLVSFPGTPFATTTDSHGLYRLPVLLTGSRLLRFDHPRLTVLLGEAAAEVELHPDSVQTVNLLLGKGLASHASLCGPSPVGGPPLAGLLGTVKEEASDTVLPGAEVMVVWADTGGTRRGLLAHADDFGNYRICGIPTRTSFTLAARRSRRGSDPVELDLAPGEMVECDLTISLAPPRPPAALVARVTNQKTGAPISGASVVLLEPDLSSASDSVGLFGLGGIAADWVTVVIRREGFRPVVRRMRLLRGDTLTAEFTMEPMPKVPAAQSPRIPLRRIPSER